MSESWNFLFILAFIIFFKNILSFIVHPIKWVVLVFGVLFIVIISLSFTTLPFWMYYSLGHTEYKLTSNPEYIVVMSGAGIPSESGLMRTYRAAEIGKIFPDAKIIVTMPGISTDTTSASYLMKKELMIRGVLGSRISFENKGTNTRSQALAIKSMLKENPVALVVTSPEHLYRSIASFHKVGLTNTVGESAFSQHMEVSFNFEDENLGGNTFVPNIGGNTQVRYQFWTHLKYQVIVYREYVAIAFYKLKGWI